MTYESYTLYRLGSWLATRVPTWFAYFIAGTLAELNFFLNRRSRRGIWTNQAHVLPPDTGWFRRFRYARAAFRNLGYSVVDFFRIPQMTETSKDQIVAECRGWEYLREAMDAGVGGIITSLHMGSFEMAAAYLALRGIPLTALALPHKDHRIDEIYVQSRTALGMEVVPIGGSLPKLEDALRRGRFIALLVDRDTRGKGPILPFLGQPTRMPDGHALLALRTGAWIFPFCTYRLRNGKHVIDMARPIIPDPAVDTQESLTRRCIEELERFIYQHPDQWFSFYNLWSKTELPVA